MPVLAASDKNLRRSQSQSQVNKPSQDLLGLTLHPIDSSATTGDDSQLSKPADSSVGTAAGLDVSVASSTSKEVTDILGAFGDLSQPPQPLLPPKQQNQASSSSPATSQRPSSVQRERITNSLVALPRPPSRHSSAITSGSATISGRVRATPSPIPASLLGDNKLSLARQDSGGGGARKRSSSSSPTPAGGEQAASAGPTPPPTTSSSTLPRFGTSRGPSPLTLSLSDVIPIAVAFQEVCHACFRGADETLCQVRLVGDMMVSFPAGIVQVFMSNPNPAQLMFRIKNSSVIDSMLPNRQLINP